MGSNMQHVKGLEGLLLALRELPTEVAGKNGGPARGALARGAKIIRDEARLNAPKDSGELAKNIVMKRDTKPRQSGVGERYTVGVRGGSKRYANTKRNVRKGRAGAEYKTAGNTYYWRFKEFGTEKMKAEPFLRPAFESKKQQALSVIAETLRKGIERAAKKVAGGR